MAHRRNNDGLEAPRNSMELSMDVSQSFQLVHENAPYCCQVKKYSSKTNIYHNGATIKRLLDEELSSRTNARLTAPNIIARLMGMDTLPSEVKPIVCPKEVQNQDSRKYKLSEINAANACFVNSKPIKQTKQELLRYNNYGIRDSSRSTKNQRLAKPQRREHPEEETLQKFKKEFEAWQAFKVLEYSRALQRKRKGKDKQSFAEENLDNQQVGKCTDISRISAYKEPSKPKKYVSPNKLKTDMLKYDNLQDKGYMGKQWCNLRDSTSSRNRLKTSDVEQIVNAQFHKKKQVTPSSRRIVILKASSEMIDNIEEPGTDSSEILEKDGSMKDFLEEVKERLKFEMQRKVKNNYMTKGCSSQASLSGRPADLKQLAQDIAKHIRGSVSKDIGMTLNQSESTRTYRSEIPLNGNYSTEVIKRDTGKLIAQKLKDVLESETDLERPVIDNTRLGAFLLMKNKVRSKSLSDFPKMGKYLSHWDDKKALSESMHRSSRREQERSTKFDAERILPRNLVRSFSAPVPRTAFGKLLPEDHGIVSRKHGLSGNISVKSRKHRKNSFNLKDRVSNLRWKLTLKAILFGKKIQSVDKPAADIFDSMEAIVTASPAVMSSGAAQDNSTEVPPSPASVSSSSHDEFCKPGHPSPVSPLEVPIFEDHTSSLVSEELIANLPELSPSEQVENCGSEELQTEAKPYEDEEPVDIESNTRAYVRDILVTYGLYDGMCFNQKVSWCDALLEPIPHWVYDELEDSCNKHEKVDSESSIWCLDETHLSRKMLFDLSNEALPVVFGTLPTTPAWKKWLLGPTSVLHGKKLLDSLWNQIQVYINPTIEEPHSIDSMAAQDVKMTPRSTILHEDIRLVVREIEFVILEELIDEFICNM